ncbi:serine/threonine-protein kinase [Nonomuraea sp. NPDC050404]|uniref:serine/threonine-protein kinase n=1 Tax=Nonomuraea sp. NPDC050404 TaxID=3155783 RepID=UPI00340CFD8C
MTAPSHAGRHRIEQLIGVGGFASVYLAHDEELRSSVAVKILADNWSRQPGVRERFLQEARLLRRADSHLLVQVFDIGELDDGRPYFVMTYADRGTLEERLRGGPLSLEETLGLMGEICQGVAVLHSIGVVHRDLKPSNVLFCSRPEGGERVMVADLGIARSTDHLSGLTLPAGSPGYRAPEQLYFDGAPDARADVHGLGALTYHMLTGRVAAKPELRVPPSELRPEVPAAVDAAVLRALHPDREERWPDAAAYAAALTGRTPPLTPQPPPPPQPPQNGHDGKPQSGRDGESPAGSGGQSRDGSGGQSHGESGGQSGNGNGGESRDGSGGRRRRGLVVGAAAAVVAVVAGTAVAVTLARTPDAPPGTATGTGTSTGATTDGGTGAPRTPAGDQTGRYLREDSDIPREYRGWIVQAGTYCEEPGLSPALIAAMLKAESGFDPRLSDPDKDEYGIARWTPKVLWHWQPGGLDKPMPEPPLSPELSIVSIGRFMCTMGPRVTGLPGDPALKLAALYRSGVDPLTRAGGIPEKWRPYTTKVSRYMNDYRPA